jgi:hypothetical protein
VSSSRIWARHPGKDGRAGFFKQATVTSQERTCHQRVITLSLISSKKKASTSFSEDKETKTLLLT